MRARYLVVGSAGAAYVVASHWLMTRAPASSWNAVVIVGPMLALLAVVGWRRRLRVLAAVAALALAALLAQALLGGGIAPESLYLAQHVAVHLALAFVFGATLLAGREPLITALARRVHGQLSPPMAAYCRSLTRLWTGYFLVMAALSLLIHAFAPFTVWATFANLVTPLALATLFIAEYLLRYRLHPEFDRAGWREAIRAYAGRSAVAPERPLEHDRPR